MPPFLWQKYGIASQMSILKTRPLCAAYQNLSALPLLTYLLSSQSSSIPLRLETIDIGWRDTHYPLTMLRGFKVLKNITLDVYHLFPRKMWLESEQHAPRTKSPTMESHWPIDLSGIVPASIERLKITRSPFAQASLPVAGRYSCQRPLGFCEGEESSELKLAGHLH